MPPADALLYVCGLARLIDGVHDAARLADRVRCERFTPARRPGDEPIVVELRRSCRRVQVRSDQTILEAVQAVGVAAPSSCRTGSCGTCATKVLGGTPAHRDTVLSDNERDRAGLMCICVSCAISPRLELDL